LAQTRSPLRSYAPEVKEVSAADCSARSIAIAGITSIAAADRYLREVFVPAYNARFAVTAEQPGSAFVAIGDLDLDHILCVEEPRQVGNDNIVLWRRRRLQIPASPLRPHFVRATVKVRQHLDGTLSIFHGPAMHCPIRPGRTGHCPARLTPLGANQPEYFASSEDVACEGGLSAMKGSCLCGARASAVMSSLCCNSE
jgi:hypothetical protein